MSNVDVKKVMDTWTLQMGYPVVTLKRKGSQYTAEQAPFLLNPNSEHSKEYNSPFGYVEFKLFPITFTQTHFHKH